MGAMGGMWIFWILIIIAAVFSIRWMVGASRGPAGFRETPEEILERRYAGGEIDKTEYEHRLTDLRR